MKKRGLICILISFILVIFSVNCVFAVEGEDTPAVSETTPEAGSTTQPAEEITEPPTDAPTEETTQAPSDSPTEEGTPTPEPPTEQVTEPPSVDPTDVPDPDTTDSPSMTPTPVQTGTPTPTSTPAPTQTPTSTPYATVVPPDITESYPKPSKLSDKSVESKSPSVIKIDGIYDAMWDNIEAVPIKNVAWGENGADGSFKLYWDKEALYVLIDVNDTTPDTRSERFTRQDCVEVFFNENASKPNEYEAGDKHFKVNRDGVAEFGNGADDTVVKYGLIPKDNGYMVEASITFTTITPVYGQAIGFDVRINDSQGHQFRDYMLQWSDTSMETYKNLSRIGIIYLK